jgi:hypothetical protein
MVDPSKPSASAEESHEPQSESKLPASTAIPPRDLQVQKHAEGQQKSDARLLEATKKEIERDVSNREPAPDQEAWGIPALVEYAKEDKKRQQAAEVAQNAAFEQGVYNALKRREEDAKGLKPSDPKPIELGPASDEIREDGYSDSDVRDYFEGRYAPRPSPKAERLAGVSASNPKKSDTAQAAQRGESKAVETQLPKIIGGLFILVVTLVGGIATAYQLAGIVSLAVAHTILFFAWIGFLGGLLLIEYGLSIPRPKLKRIVIATVLGSLLFIALADAIMLYLKAQQAGSTVGPQNVAVKADINVHVAFFRTHLLDSIVGDRALMIEATEDLKYGCLTEPEVAWVKPFTNVRIRERDDVGIRFIIKNAGAAPVNSLRISIDPWQDLPRAALTTSSNIEPARMSSVTSRDDTFDVITVPRIPPLVTAVVTYYVSLPPEKRSETRSFAFPVQVMSSEDTGSILRLFQVSVAWADSAEADVTGRPVGYPIDMVTPVGYERLYGESARALVPLKLPYCTAEATPP